MKKGNVIKVTLIISIVILLSLISFVGIYMKKTNQYVDIMPKYHLGMDIGQRRVITLKVNKGTSTIIYDENGKKVNSIPEDADESKYKKEEVIINKNEVLTEENYKKTKSIIEKRLNKINADDYEIKYSKNTGDIIVELPENDKTNNAVNVLTATGRFELVSEDTEEVLISNNDLKRAKVSYYNENNETSVYLIVELNKEGKKKLKDVSNTYVDTVEKVTTVDEKTGEETTKDNTISKKAILRLDWPNSYTGNLEYSDVITQSFSNEMSDGTFQLKIGTAKNDEMLENYYNQAFQISSILNSGLSEVKYEVDGNEVLETEITTTQISIAIITLIVIFVIVSLLIIFKYKLLGALGTISNISMIACMLIFIRLTKVTIAITALPSIISIIIVNTFIIVTLIQKVKDSENSKSDIWKAVLKTIDVLIVALIISVVFIFMFSEAIVSSGMIMFWGIISIILTNLLFTRPLLLAVDKN